MDAQCTSRIKRSTLATAVQIDLAKTVAAQPAAAFATVAATAAGLDPRPCGGLIGPATDGAENQGKSCAAVPAKSETSIKCSETSSSRQVLLIAQCLLGVQAFFRG
jgi:hypothetical protein